MTIIFDEFYSTIIARRFITNQYYFNVKKFHYPIYNINIWNFCTNKRPWIFLNKRGNGKNEAFIRIINRRVKNGTRKNFNFRY